MNEQKYPQFERLHILRTEALISIRDRAFDTLPLMLDNYADGVVSGCRLQTTDTLLTLRPGIILRDGFLYLIKEPMSVEYAPTEQYVMLKLNFEPEHETENFAQRNVSISLSPLVELAPNEMELCRFKLKKGAILRANYVDFFDRVTEFDTVNAINRPHAAVGSSTLSPDITLAFAIEAKDFELDERDFAFCMEALSGKVLRAEQIEMYIEHRLKVELPTVTNRILYDHLGLVLKEIKNGRRREITGTRRRRREIIVE